MVWFILASIIIFVLAAYAAFLMFKLREQNRVQQLIKDQQEQKQLTRDLKTIDSIVLISKAVNEQQCEISEGCWRLSVLIDSMPEHKEIMNSKFPAIFKLYNEISHMPILEARKALSKKERLKLDLERMGIEQELEAQVLADAKLLVTYASSIKEDLEQKQK
ncbi:DUF2489 domain-containing protein [Thalassomonas sp. M1454]|uniref:DUF2489 domain-containing protein n=1 Tax=Thalassomonas sp. M1454 TaxID=2594477 RepID=UPI00117D8B8C|nr:DUF2489 domain-containing protein [Thalassomonas sp. M1454]TRX54911.1 DUF2489 domain-containing protein [Thalassomonas sp. M1454]